VTSHQKRSVLREQTIHGTASWSSVKPENNRTIGRIFLRFNKPDQVEQNTLMLIKAMFGTAYYHTIPTRMKKGHFLNAWNIWIIQGSQVTRIGRETHAIQPVHTPHCVFLTLKRQCQPFCPASFV